MEILEGIIWGFVGGMGTVGAGFAEKIHKEDFDAMKAGLTCLLGGALGIVLSLSGLDLGAVGNTTTIAYLTYAAENILKRTGLSPSKVMKLEP